MGCGNAVLVCLASDAIKIQCVTCLMPQTTFPRFTHVILWPQMQTNINNKFQPRPRHGKHTQSQKGNTAEASPNLAKFFLPVENAKLITLIN